MKRRRFLAATVLTALSAKLVKAESEPYRPEVSTPTPEEWKENEINIAWLGHSTVLLKLFDKIIITDPIFFNSVGVQLLGLTIGPSRYTPLAMDRERIPKPDLVLLSHAHMDHMDLPSLEYLTDKYPGEIDCITAYNTQDVIEDLPWKSLQEMDWGEEQSKQGIKFTAVKVKHFGWRFPGEKDRSRGFMKDGRSFNAYILESNGKRILFGGDTANTDSFKKLNTQVDIAIMPIGAYNPWTVNHCNPEEAMQMAADVNAKVFIPIHCNTFRQGMEPIEEPVKRMLAAAPKHVMQIGISRLGETFNLA